MRRWRARGHGRGHRRIVGIVEANEDGSHECRIERYRAQATIVLGIGRKFEFDGQDEHLGSRRRVRARESGDHHAIGRKRRLFRDDRGAKPVQPPVGQVGCFGITGAIQSPMHCAQLSSHFAQVLF